MMLKQRKITMLIVLLQAPVKKTEAVCLPEMLNSHWRGRVSIQAVRVERLEDIRRLVRGMQPDVLHICGHCSPGGRMIFADDSGWMRSWCTKEKLLRTVTHTRRHHVFQLVYMNAPVTAEDFAAGNGQIQVLAGMRDASDDAVSQTFVLAFYSQLLQKVPLQLAFHRAEQTLLPGKQRGTMLLRVAAGVDSRVWSLMPGGRPVKKKALLAAAGRKEYQYQQRGEKNAGNEPASPCLLADSSVPASGEL